MADFGKRFRYASSGSDSDVKSAANLLAEGEVLKKFYAQMLAIVRSDSPRAPLTLAEASGIASKYVSEQNSRKTVFHYGASTGESDLGAEFEFSYLRTDEHRQSYWKRTFWKDVESIDHITRRQTARLLVNKATGGVRWFEGPVEESHRLTPSGWN